MTPLQSRRAGMGFSVVGIQLSADDVARIRFGYSAVWETTASLYALTNPSPYALHRPLRRQLTAAGRSAAAILSELTCVPGWIPDTLSPPPHSGPVEPNLEFADIRSTPTCVAEEDLDVLSRNRPCSRWATMCPDQFVDEVAALLMEYWVHELAPRWEMIESVNNSDARHRQRGLARDGVGAALQLLHPSVSYERSVIRIEMALHHCRLTGTGEGVWLVPSVFRWPKVGLASIPSGAFVISYPAQGAGTIWEERKSRERGLDALVGRSRAAVLTDLDVPRSTTALARRLELAPATVSAHLSRLAAAGLVSSARDGRLVLYSRTSLGTLLLSSDPAVDEPTHEVHHSGSLPAQHS
jgi:DNA-binding transcriptional ArsR family regulator